MMPDGISISSKIIKDLDELIKNEILILVRNNSNYIEFTQFNSFKGIFYDISFILRKIFSSKKCTGEKRVL